MSKTPVQIAVTYEQIGALKELADIANRVLAEAPADASYYSAFLDCEGVSHRLTLEQLRLLSSLPAALQSAAETPRATCELCGGTGMRGPEATQCPCGIPSPATNTAAPETAAVARHMRDFELFVAQIAPKLHWKVWQDFGSDRSLYSGGFDGWQHGFGMASFEPRPLAELIPEMKAALALAATATEGSVE